jgi:hypothetical protein
MSIKLFITPYTDKSFVVLGETLEHTKALTQLGGKFNPSLKMGAGWIFSNLRQDSVRKYIDTGEIVPYVYTEQDKAKYTTQNKKVDNNNIQLKVLFEELCEAFDPKCEYEGGDIIDVIKKFQQKYLQIQDTPKLSLKSSTTTNDIKPTKRLAKKVAEIVKPAKTEDFQMDSEED